MSDNPTVTAWLRSPGSSRLSPRYGWHFYFRRRVVSGTLSAAGIAVVASTLLPVAALATKGRKLLLAIIILDIPLQIGPHLFYSDDLAALGAVNGLEISLTMVALAGLYASWFVGYATKPEAQPRLTLRASLPLGAYLAFEAVSLFVAKDIALSFYELFLTMEMFLLYVYLINWIKTRRDVAFVVQMLLIGLIFESAIMIGLRVAGHAFGFPGFRGYIVLADDPEGTEGFSRVGGTLVSPNTAASYLSMMLPPVLGLLVFTRMRRWYKSLAVIAFGLGVFALILTFSREGWLAFFLTSLALCLIGWRDLRPVNKVVCVFGLSLVLICFCFRNPVSERLLGSDEGAAYSRVPLMKLAFGMIQEQPIMGVGVNNFTLNIPEYVTNELRGEWLYAVHNKYLLIWAETGLGGLVSYLWFLVATLRRGWQGWKYKDPFYSSLSLGLAAGISSLMICLMFEPDRGRPLTQLLLVMATLITAIHSWKVPTMPGRNR